jgi:ATP-dependent Lon protease
MLTKSELTAFCKLFNKRRGTRCKAETGQMTDVLMQLRLFEDNSNSQITYDLLKDMLDYAPLEHIKKLTEFMSIRNVKMYLMDQQEQEEQLPEKKETLPNEEEHYQEMNEVVKSFGIIESTLANVLTEKYAPQMADEIKLKVDEYIKENYGPIQRKVIYEVPEHGQVEAVTHEMFETVLAFVLANEPVMLVGPAGTGKNVLCQQIAEAMDLPFYFSNAVTQEYKLTG